MEVKISNFYNYLTIGRLHILCVISRDVPDRPLTIPPNMDILVLESGVCDRIALNK